MSDYLNPRRFARVMEMDRNGPPTCGTLEDQGHVRDAINRYIEWDNGFDRVLYALDLEVNRQGRSFLWFNFLYEDFPGGLRAQAWKVVIQLFPTSGGSWNDAVWESVVLHEIGHWIGMWILDPPDREENWATDFQQWVFSGAEPIGHVYERLDAVGAQDTVKVREGNIE